MTLAKKNVVSANGQKQKRRQADLVEQEAFDDGLQVRRVPSHVNYHKSRSAGTRFPFVGRAHTHALFLTTFRRTPTVNAEDQTNSEGSIRKVSARCVCR